MSVKRFLYEVFGNDISSEFYLEFNKETSDYILFGLGHTITPFYDRHIPKNNKIFLLNYEDDFIFYGFGANSMKKEITFYKYSIISRNHTKIKKIDCNRCFVFIDKKIEYPKI